MLGKLTRHQRRLVQEDQRQAKKLAQMTRRACDLYLVRHGETDWNKQQRLQGQLQPGPPLNALGVEQARRLGRGLALQEGAAFEAVYGSDLLRAEMTVEMMAPLLGAAAGGRPPPVASRPELRERHLGLCQGFTFAEAAQRHPAACAALASPKGNDSIEGGGESVNALTTRVAAALERIAGDHPGGRVVVVTHGGVLQAAYRRATGAAAPGRAANCAINVVRIEGGTWAVVAWGEVAHLEGTGFAEAAFGGGLAG